MPMRLMAAAVLWALPAFGQSVPPGTRRNQFASTPNGPAMLPPHVGGASSLLNLGVRHQYNSPRAEKYNRQVDIDLDNPVPLENAADMNTHTRRSFLGALAAPVAAAPARQPNVVFILADDLGWRDTALYGSTYYETNGDLVCIDHPKGLSTIFSETRGGAYPAEGCHIRRRKCNHSAIPRGAYR